MKILYLTLMLIVLPLLALSQEKENGNEEEKKSSLSVFIGGTTNKDATAFTIGLDYQYRINKLIGVGLVLDYATPEIKSLLLAPAAFFHLWHFEIVVAPGAEFSGDEVSFVFRTGVSYEFELNRFTISPSLLFDTERSDEVSLVYGVAFGFKL